MTINTNQIFDVVNQLIESVPPHVTLQAAAKGRSAAEVEAVIQAGVTQIGYNYIQEAIPIIQHFGNRVSWHMIGHLQRNKAKLAVQHFDMIETVDSWRLAQMLDHRCASEGIRMPVLIEINSGREENKTGVFPEDVDLLVEKLSKLKNIHVEGVMTMGPRFGNPEDSRAFFIATRKIFERFEAQNIPNVEMRFLSMGMSNSYSIAIEEGANIIRIGTKIFGGREER
jgi:pyridoxal phosphate enzyme (YggS family)